MTWVRRAEVKPPPHECATPTREVVYVLPPSPPVSSGAGGGGEPRPDTWTVPDGSLGDLWRCDDCGRLWRMCRLPKEWRPAGWLTRIRASMIKEVAGG